MKYLKFELIVENLGRVECLIQDKNELLEIKNLLKFIIKF